MDELTRKKLLRQGYEKAAVEHYASCLSPAALLGPLIDRRVMTTKGRGVLVNALCNEARVLLDKEVRRAKQSAPVPHDDRPGVGKKPGTVDLPVLAVWPEDISVSGPAEVELPPVPKPAPGERVEVKEDDVRKVAAWVDGSSSGGRGPGGYGVVLLDVASGTTKEFSGRAEDTTNQRMEIMAACVALEKVREGCSVIIYSDSAYVVNCVNQKWMNGWRKNGWKTRRKEAVKNTDLWERLANAIERHREVRFEHVYGHSGVEGNETADALAVSAKKGVVKSEV